MSVVPKPVPMAECLNFGMGLDDNEDLMHLQPNGQIFHDVIFKYMDFALPSQNEKKDVLLVNPESVEHSPLNHANNVSNSLSECEDKFAECSLDDFDSADEGKSDDDDLKPGVPSVDSALYFLPVNYNKRNPWRRTIGLHVYGNELRSATYPARSSVKKLRFAQAKKRLNYLYSYFSVEILDCDDISSITVGISRKDYPSKVAPGKNSGSVGYSSDSGVVSIRDTLFLNGHRFSKGDVIGCGIIYPTRYKCYADLSTDDNSDGMTDVVLTSLANTNIKSMDFVCTVLNLNNANSDADEDAETEITSSRGLAHNNIDTDECDYYNENFVESRTQVEVYFTHNMRVVGKVLSHVPAGGFYPTVHVFSCGAIKMNVDLNPPLS